MISDEKILAALARIDPRFIDALALEPEVVLPDASSSMAELAELARSSPELKIRAAAARKLMQAGDESLLARFRHELGSPAPEVVRAAVHAAGVAKDPLAVAKLMQLVTETGDASVRDEAMWALGEIGGAAVLVGGESAEFTSAERGRIAPLLIAAWRAGKSEDHAIEALGKLADQSILSDLTFPLREGPTHVRKAAAEAICRILDRHPRPTANIVPYVSACLAREEDPMIGVLLLSALVRLGEAISPLVVHRVLGLVFRGQEMRAYLGRLL